jgi:drug/metabolite transporter (DMT)-like permease
MDRRDQIDASGAAALVAMALFLAFGQVVVKVVNEGFQPVFFAAVRSLGAAPCIWLWIRANGRRLDFRSGTLVPGLLMGVFFAAEYVCLFWALDLTTVSRSAVIFYSMPVWLSLGAHFLLPSEPMSPRKALGLALALCGIAWAFAHRGTGIGGGSLTGDLLSLLAAMSWAALALTARATKLREVRPEMQHFWQLSVSAVILLALAPFFGPFLRDPTALHWAGLAFHTVAMAAAGFLVWFWLLSVYPASGVASFSFLSPIFGIALGWLLLGETLGPGTLVAGALVALGLALINWPARRRPAALPG